MKKQLILASIFLMFFTVKMSAQTISPSDITGTWLTQEGTVQIKITEVNKSFQGLIVWMKQPNENGKPKLDVHNPAPSKRENPLVGKTLIIYNLKFNGSDKWEDGSIYDSRNGKEYKCSIKMEGKDKLKVRGYVGVSILGKTTDWTRIK